MSFFFLAEISTVPRHNTGSVFLLTNDCQHATGYGAAIPPNIHFISKCNKTLKNATAYLSRVYFTNRFHAKKKKYIYILKWLDIKYCTTINNIEK
jgi:hypothetical protein